MLLLSLSWQWSWKGKMYYFWLPQELKESVSIHRLPLKTVLLFSFWFEGIQKHRVSIRPWVRVTCFNSYEDSLLQQLPFINTLNHIWKINLLQNIFRTWSMSDWLWLNYRWKLKTNVSPLLHYNRLLAVVNL